MGVRRTLIDNLHTLISEVDGIQSVSKYPELDIAGYPAVFIADSEVPGDYQSSQDNIRIYAFKIWILNQYDQGSFTDAVDAVRDLADLITNKIDEQESPNSQREMANNIGAGYTLVGVNATNGQTINDSVEKTIATELTVRCKIVVDLTALT